MKKIIIGIIASMILLSACTKPECRTRKGKAKRKHYNSIQYR